MINLVLSASPIDEVPGRLALATFFEDIRPLKGSTSMIDWRLNGRLSDLILQGRVSGRYAESLIMPSQGRLAAREILLFGLGSASELTEQKFEKGFVALIDKLALLKSTDFVLSMSDFARDFMSWRAILRVFMSSLSLRYGDQDFHVICSEDARWVSEAKKRNMDFGPQVAVSYA